MTKEFRKKKNKRQNHPSIFNEWSTIQGSSFRISYKYLRINNNSLEKVTFQCIPILVSSNCRYVRHNSYKRKKWQIHIVHVTQETDVATFIVLRQ